MVIEDGSIEGGKSLEATDSLDNMGRNDHSVKVDFTLADVVCPQRPNLFKQP
jgi:hypothetical protein